MENVEEIGLDFADVASQFTEFEDQWVAINESGDKVVASGASIFEVDKEAERQGYEIVFCSRYLARIMALLLSQDEIQVYPVS